MSVVMRDRRFVLLILFSLLGAITSGILIEHHVNPEIKSELLKSVCDIGGSSGCEAVNQSDASNFLGMPVAFWGFLFYSFAFCFAIFYIRYKKIFFIRLIFWLSLLAVIVDLTLFLYSLIIVEAVCNLCIITYVATLGTLIISGLILKKTEKKDGLLSFSFDFSLLREQPLIASIVLFSLIVVIFFGSFIFLYAKSSSLPISSTGGHDALLEEAWKSFQKEYESTTAHEISIEHSPYKGAKDPVITVVEFADFLCPHCKLAGNRLKEIVRKYEKSVKVVFKNYPLDQKCNKNIKRKLHDGACKIAYLGLCASRQRIPAFWIVHDQVFAQHDTWNQAGNVPDSDFTRIMQSAGINIQAASSCYKTERTKSDVIKDIELGDSLGITSTPTVFINGKKIKGGIPNDYFWERLLAYEVKKQMGAN